MSAQINSKENPQREVQLTRGELAGLFKISESTVKRIGSLKPVHKNSRVLRYTSRDVDHMVQLGYTIDYVKAQEHQIALPVLPALKPALQETEGFPVNGSKGNRDEAELLVELLRRHLRNNPSAKPHLLRFLGELLTSGPLDQVA